MRREWSVGVSKEIVEDNQDQSIEKCFRCREPMKRAENMKYWWYYCDKCETTSANKRK
jgi:hypothetical protein